MEEIKPLQHLYGIGNNFFDSLSELREFCGATNRSTTGWLKLDYLGEYEGRTDVIRTWNSSTDSISIFCVPVFTEEQNYDWSMLYYEMYDPRENRWKQCQGNLTTYYRALKSRGVEFSNYPYASVEKFLDSVKPTPIEPTTGGRQFTIGTHPGTK